MSYCGDGPVAGHSGDTIDNLTLLCSRVYTPRLLRHSGQSSDEIATFTGVPKGPKKTNTVRSSQSPARIGDAAGQSRLFADRGTGSNRTKFQVILEDPNWFSWDDR